MQRLKAKDVQLLQKERCPPGTFFLMFGGGGWKTSHQQIFRFQRNFGGIGAACHGRGNPERTIETVQVPLFQSWAWEPGSKGLDLH